MKYLTLIRPIGGYKGNVMEVFPQYTHRYAGNYKLSFWLSEIVVDWIEL
jgi:hypothetical protein